MGEPAPFIDAARSMRDSHLKHGLCEIDGDGRMLHGDSSLLWPLRGRFTWHDDAASAGGIHSIACTRRRGCTRGRAAGDALTLRDYRRARCDMGTPEEDDFERTAKIPLIWQITARQLIAAGNRLRVGHEAAKETLSFYSSRMPILLLFGLAAENLAKGVLVARGVLPAVPDNKKGSLKLNDEIKGHNLDALCVTVGLVLDATDKDVLNNLSWTTQAGKYPVGTRPAISPGDPTPMWLELTNLDRACQLLERLEDALRNTGQPWILEKVDLCKLGL